MRSIEFSRTIPVLSHVRRLRVAATAAILPVLAGCGMMGAMIPAVDVGDPMGVNQRIVLATVQDGPIALRSLTHVDRTTTMDLPDVEQNLRGFGVAGLHIDAGFSGEVTLTGADLSSAPDAFTIDGALVEATLADERDGSVTFRDEAELDLTFEKTSCDADACSYRYAGDDDVGSALDLNWTDRAKLDALVEILVKRGEETPNEGTFRVALQFDGEDSLAGYTVRFTLVSEGSKLKLG